MHIIFPGIHGPYGEDAYSLVAIVDGKPIACAISMKALEDVSGGIQDAEQAFLSNRDTIEEKAEEKIRAGQFEDGKILIYRGDFGQ